MPLGTWDDRERNSEMNRDRRVILVGLDGATFDLLGPWIDEGLLPNLAKLQMQGTWGELRSTIPPTTPPAWACIFTGVNPGKHGIYDFRESPFRDPERPLISLKSVKVERLWGLLNRHGRRVGIMNVPITYPPEPVDGFMISGMMTPGEDSPYTYPPELKERLAKAVGEYIVDIDIPQFDVELEEDAMAFLRQITYAFERRKEAFFYLLDDTMWDFFMVVFVLPDRIQHLFWKYLDPESRLYQTELGKKVRAAVILAYQAMDRMFGDLLKRLDDRTCLMVASDHGFGPTKAFINVNCWLEDLGLLKLRGLKAIEKGLFYRAMTFNESRWVKRLIPRGIQGAIRRKVRKTRSTFKTDVEASIDWEGTKAFFASIPGQGIYINLRRGGTGVVEPGREYEELRALIKNELYRLKDPRTKEPIVDQVWYREELYSGPQVAYAPDILFMAKNYSYLGRALFGATEWVRSAESVPIGFHRVNGMFMALGPGIKKGCRVEGASVLDITPTILYAMSLPVPSYMDGNVLKEIWEPERLTSQPIAYA